MAELGSRRFGDYELLELLGEGGMGQVFRARHEALDREVAIKFLRRRDDSSSDDGSRKRFERETRIHLELQHPNLVKVLDAGILEGQQFLVMEPMGGGSLTRHLERHGCLPVPEIRRVLEAVSAGLAYLHERGMVHRDVKPENVLLDAQGVIKLTDFGLARRREDTMLTGTREFVGTVAYASPEAVMGAGSEAPSDVYALGMLTYWMIAGRLPFDVRSPETFLHQVVVMQPDPPSRARPDTPPDLEDLVMRMLDKDPERRPLAGAIAARAAGAMKEDPPTPLKARPRGSNRVVAAEAAAGQTRQFSRNATVTFITTCALGAGLFLGLGVGSRPGPGPREAPSPRPYAAAPAETGPIELVDHDLIATHQAIHLRGRTGRPVKLRLLVESEGHATRMVDDPVASLWHRLDLGAPAGRSCRITVLAPEGGRVSYPEPRTIRVPLEEDSRRLFESVSRKISVAPTPLQMEILSLDRDDPTILALEERPHALWSDRGQDLLHGILRDQPWSSFPVLSRLIGRTSGPLLEPLLSGCLKPSTWSRASAYIRTRQYADADRAVTALLERGTADTIQHALEFCRKGKEAWWPGLPDADKPRLDGVPYRALRALAVSRLDLARGLAREGSIEDVAHAAYLVSFLGSGSDAGHQPVPDARVRVAALMGLSDRMAREPQVIGITSWRPSASQQPAEWILGGFGLARTGSLGPHLDPGSVASGGKIALGDRWRLAALVRALAASRAPDVIARLVPWFEVDDEELRAAALEALCRQLSGRGMRVPWQAAGTAGDLPIGRMGEVVRRTVVTGSARAMRVLALALLGEESCVPEARGLLGETDPLVTAGARLALMIGLDGEVGADSAAATGDTRRAWIELGRYFAPEEGSTDAKEPGSAEDPHLFLLDPLLPWQDTGIDVRAGDHIRVEYSGAARGGRDSPFVEAGRELWVEAIIGDQRVPVLDVENGLWRPTCRFRAAGTGRLLLRTGIEEFGRAGDTWIREPLAMISSRAVVLARVTGLRP